MGDTHQSMHFVQNNELKPFCSHFKVNCAEVKFMFGYMKCTANKRIYFYTNGRSSIDLLLFGAGVSSSKPDNYLNTRQMLQSIRLNAPFYVLFCF